MGGQGFSRSCGKEAAGQKAPDRPHTQRDQFCPDCQEAAAAQPPPTTVRAPRPGSKGRHRTLAAEWGVQLSQGKGNPTQWHSCCLSDQTLLQECGGSLGSCSGEGQAPLEVTPSPHQDFNRLSQVWATTEPPWPRLDRDARSDRLRTIWGDLHCLDALSLAPSPGKGR